MSDKVPVSRRASAHAKELGTVVWNEYKQKREGYKAQGISPQEAYKRAYIELGIQDKWQDWRSRKNAAAVLGMDVTLTPGEMRTVVPGYTQAGMVKAEFVGDDVLSFAEEILWARDQRALTENEAPPPTRFPSKGALFWYQTALTSRDKFMGMVASVSKPAGEGENLFLLDTQHQFKEIEEQLVDAVRECGEKLVEMEAGFGELLKEAVT